MGLDIGKYLKFKPWGAIKFAKGVNGALAFVGIALEAWDSWEQHQREENFKTAITEIVDNFENQRQDFIDLVNSVDFLKDFFPDYRRLEEQQLELQSNLQESSARQQRFQAWREEAETIEADFRVLSHYKQEDLALHEKA